MGPYNKKIRHTHNAIFLTCIVIFATLLILHSSVIYSQNEDLDTLHLAIALIGLFVIQQLCYCIFSLGFLIFGKLSGYGFSFLRIAFLTWKKDKSGKISFSFTSEKGASSQCKMYPPDMKDGKVPYIMYGLGNTFLCIIFIAISATILAFNFYTPIISSLLITFIFILLINVILNAYDGSIRRIREIGKSPYAMKGHWLLCKFADPDFQNTSLKNMPSSWFEFSMDADTSMNLVSSLGLFYGERLMEEKRFDEAKKVFAKITEPDTGLLYDQYMYALCDRIYCELVTSNNSDSAQELYTHKLKPFMSNVRTYTILRTNFACALLIENNPTGAAQIKADFFTACQNSQNKEDIQAETDLLLYAENLYSEKNTTA